MGWLSSFISNPIDTIGNTLEDVTQGVSDLGSSIDDTILQPVTNAVSDLGSSIDDTVNQIPGGWLTAAMLASGYADPTMFGGEAAVAPEAAGWDAATAGAYGGPETSSALTSSSLGQASNIAPAAAGEDFTLASLQQEPGLIGADYEQMPGNGMFGGSAVNQPLTSPSTLSLDGILAKAKDMGIGLNLPTAMVGSSLYDMYAKNQMAKQLQTRQTQQQAAVNNFYAPGSAEYNTLVEQMKRQAVQAGRPIDSAQFASSLASAVADKKMQAQTQMASGQNNLLTSQLGNQYGGLNTLFNNMALYTMLQKKGLANA
jgi:hypothetical protein